MGRTKQVWESFFTRLRSPRFSHCGFKRLNNLGRCIAPCYWNHKHPLGVDCTGTTGKTMDLEGGREIPLENRCKLEV